MKALLIIFSLLLSLSVFAGEKEAGLSKDEMFKKMSEKKYSLLKEKINLTADEEKIILPILKDYDKKRFDLMADHFKKGKELRDAEKKDYDAILKHQKEGLELMKKSLDAEKAKIADLEKAKVKSEIIVKLERFEKRFMGKMMKGHGKHHKDGGCEDGDCPRKHKGKKDKDDDDDDF